MPAITFAPFLTRAQYEAFEAEILDAERHNLWSTFVKLNPAWPYPCLCSKCKEEKA